MAQITRGSLRFRHGLKTAKQENDNGMRPSTEAEIETVLKAIDRWDNAQCTGPDFLISVGVQCFLPPG